MAKETNKFQAVVDRTKRLLQHFKRSVGISWSASHLLFIVRIVYEAISVAIPIVSLFLSRSIVNILASNTYPEQQKDFGNYNLSW